LIKETKADVITVTNTEIPSTAAEFKINGFITICPLTGKGGKTRVIVLVREDVATQSKARVREDFMAEARPFHPCGCRWMHVAWDVSTTQRFC
jgi:hypothetical protein